MSPKSINHEGNVTNALRLIDEAAAPGADAVKFQTFRPEHFVSRTDADRFARLQRFVLLWKAYPQLAAAARAKNLLMLSTPLDLESAERLVSWVDAFQDRFGR